MPPSTPSLAPPLAIEAIDETREGACLITDAAKVLSDVAPLLPGKISVDKLPVGPTAQLPATDVTDTTYARQCEKQLPTAEYAREAPTSIRLRGALHIDPH